MSGALKLGILIAASALAVALLWLSLGLPWPISSFGNRYQLWSGSLVVSIALLAFTFELSRRNFLRLIGVLVLLSAVAGRLAIIQFLEGEKTPFDQSNIFSVLSEQGSLGIITLGAALLILTGGIDLSVGSVVGLSAVLFGTLLESGAAPLTALGLCLGAGILIGAMNGLLVTQLRLQSFLVTLCGMFMFRGFARAINTSNTGLQQAKGNHPEFAESLDSLRALLVGKAANGAVEFPATLAVMMFLAALVAVVLHKSAYGRYWFAIGYNDQAARYAGIGVEKNRIFVFILCSTLAAFGGVLLLLWGGSANPANAGNSYELYAITAAVLGGVSLKGGECTAAGLILGALVQPIIFNWMSFDEIPDSAQLWVMGLALLAGTVADELIRRFRRSTKG